MKPITQYVCNYAVLRFQPYPETGEFVNMGVAVQCPETGLLEVLVEQRKQRRVTDFFPELDKAQFRATREAVETEFQRVMHLATKEKDKDLVRRVFQEMVRPRESVFRFSEVRTILTEEVETLTRQLFERHVQRNFAKQKEYQETVMARRYYEVLRQLRPERHFRRDIVIRGDLYHVKLPIASEAMSIVSEVPQRAIKPLDLNRADATAIIEHGDAWVTRLNRLKMMRMKPDKLIFAINRPKRVKDELLQASDEVERGLTGAGGIVVDADDTERVVALAADDWY